MIGTPSIKLSMPPAADSRRMVRAELMGGHTHVTLVGIHVHVWLRGDRYLARGRNKGKVAFRLPFPDELLPLLHACIADRVEGPLLRSRLAFEKDKPGLWSTEEMKARFDDALFQQAPDAVQTPQD